MKVRFVDQILIGTRVYGLGEVIDVADDVARFAIARRAAVEHVETAPKPVVREAVSAPVATARRAVTR